jgi:hypothetical protein
MNELETFGSNTCRGSLAVAFGAAIAGARVQGARLGL